MTLFSGLTFVADNFYDYHNLWHGHATILPFVVWRLRNDCSVLDQSNGTISLGRAKDKYGAVGAESDKSGYRGTSFKDEAKVIGIFEKECEKVDGCRLKAAWGDNMTFCDQVRLMSETDVLVSPHGCQLTNLFLMEKNSSVMEFYPKEWRDLGGVGQYIYQRMAGWSGMQHRGSWRDPEGEDCPHADKLQCFFFFKDKQIGQDEAYFADWAAKVLGEAKEYKLSEAWKGSRQQAEASTHCPCQRSWPL